jgi:hypothetical protein
MIPAFDDGGNLPPGIHCAASPDGISFLSFFQRDRASGQPKGIVALDLTELP